MEETTQENLDAEVQEVDGANDSNDAAVTDQDAKVAEDQKKRAEKAEREVKELREQLEAKAPQPEAKEPIDTNDGSGLTEEDIIVISRVGDKEKLDMMRDIAKLKKVSLDEASSSQMYQLWEKEHEAGKKADAARLGASTGSGAKRRKNSLQTPGLTTEDHKELFNRSIGK